MIRLENTNLGHNKFYEIYENGRTVSIRYGAIGTIGTTIKKNFGSADAAREWANNTRLDKMMDGYRTVLPDDANYWKNLYNAANKQLTAIRSAVRGY